MESMLEGTLIGFEARHGFERPDKVPVALYQREWGALARTPGTEAYANVPVARL